MQVIELHWWSAKNLGWKLDSESERTYLLLQILMEMIGKEKRDITMASALFTCVAGLLTEFRRTAKLCHRTAQFV